MTEPVDPDKVKKLLDDLMAQASADANKRPPHGSMCFCGSCTDALEAAGRILAQTQDNGECILWFVQVAAAMEVLATCSLMQSEGVPLSSLIGLMSVPGDVPPQHVDTMRKVWAEILQLRETYQQVLQNTPDGSINRIFELASYYKYV